MAGNSIKNIIFDLGGIFIDIDYGKTRQAFIDLGIANFDDFYQQTHVDPLFAALETGQITPIEFYEKFRQASGSTLSDAEIKKAWCAMLGNFRKTSVAILPLLKSRYRLFLLSNINAIHYDAIHAMYKAQFAKEDFDSYFIKPYYSHLFNERKPDLAAYTTILQQNGLLAAETIFVDDTMKNIIGAEQAGLPVLFVPQNSLVENALASIGLL